MITSNTTTDMTTTTASKLIAKNPVTGLYFNGRAFEAPRAEAIALRPGTTAETFRFSWAGQVEIEEVSEITPATQAMKIVSSSKYKTSSGRIYYHMKRSDSRLFCITQHSRDGWTVECQKTFATMPAPSFRAAKQLMLEL